jgi:hypothetical protein
LKNRHDLFVVGARRTGAALCELKSIKSRMRFNGVHRAASGDRTGRDRGCHDLDFGRYLGRDLLDRGNLPDVLMGGRAGVRGAGAAAVGVHGRADPIPRVACRSLLSWREASCLVPDEASHRHMSITGDEGPDLVGVSLAML